MFLWALRVAVLSVLAVFMCHYIWIFFRNTMTVPKVKDFVVAPQIKLDAMMTPNITNATKEQENISMKEELRRFLLSGKTK